MPKAKTSLSPRDLARAVGVSESSVKRWADDGLLEFVRTAGGHRRIRMAEAVRFVRAAGMEVLRPDLLGLGAPAGGRGEVEPSGAALTEAIQRGDGAAACRMLVSAYVQGASVSGLCDGPIRAALEDAGHWWKEGAEGIALEHHAVDACVDALMEIRAMIEVPKKARIAVGGAAAGDPYVLPSLMASVILAEAGFETMNLGADVPAEALASVILSRSPDLVWRSFSVESSLPTIRGDLAALPRTKGRSYDLVVGGRGVARGLTLGDGSPVQLFESMTELAGFAKARRPRR